MTMIVILVVDDDLTIRDLVQESLEDGGFEIVIAESGSKAIAILGERRAGLRGLITDIDLGAGPDGWEVARHARELDHAIPVVYMSGASAHDWASHGVPTSTMVNKPFAPAQIVTAISALLNASDAKG